MIKLPILFSMILLLSCSEGRVNSAERSEQPALEDYAGPTELATFEGIDGVAKVESGYSGGKEKNPTYGDVSAGRTGHKEVVQITYYPEVISYLELVDIFWQQFDPTDAGGSFYDRGSQYQSAIFYHNAAQKAVAEASKKRLDGSGKFDKPIVTPIEKFDKFYKAEAYHQDYYKKNPREYKAYRVGSGRDKFIKKHWPEISAAKYPKPSKSELKKQLTDLQYKVTQEEHTERAFDNKYDGNKSKGIYVCIISGAPLFSSEAKFDSGTGWPSFTHPIDARFLTKPVDSSFGTTRVEVRSKFGDAHGGHVFYDGPKPTGLRYCMNSASLKFIAKEEMEKSGYSAYFWLVD